MTIRGEQEPQPALDDVRASAQDPASPDTLSAQDPASPDTLSASAQEPSTADAGPDSSPGPTGGGDEPEHRAFAAFLGALKAVGFYPAANPVRERLVGGYLEHLAHQGAEVSIGFRQDEVRYAGQTVLSRGQESWDLMVRLFEAGLRDLTFFPQTTPEELQNLLDLLARTVRGELNPTDEDLSVLLWEMDLPSIAYRVIDAREDPRVVLMEPETAVAGGSVDPAAWEGIHPLERYLASAGGLEETDLDPRSLRVGEDELSRLRNLAKQEGHRLRPKLVMVLLELLLVGLSDDEFGRVLGLLRGYAFDMLQMGRFVFFGRMIQRLRERIGELHGAQAAPVEALVRELSGPEAAARALAAVEAQRCDNAQAAIGFLTGMDPAGLRAILDLVAEDPERELERDPWRIAATALRHVAERSPDRLIVQAEGLSEAHLMVLARILPAGQTPERARFWSQSLSPLWAGGEAGVRAGALRLLAVARPSDLERLLQLGLGDEDALVRQTAAHLYSEVFGSRALQPLLQILLSHGFEQRDIEEQAAFYEALTKASPDEVFPLLEKTVRRRSWLAPKHWRVQKACALRALGRIPIEKSGALLMRYRNARDPMLAEASRFALDHHRQRLQGGVDAPRRAA